MVEKAAVAARADDENRAMSLIGIGLIFIGFVFQAASAVSIMFDTLWSKPWAVP
jgi:hypothetical protein